MRDEYLKGVLSSDKKNLSTSEIAARDEFNRQHPPTKGLVVADDLRKMELPAVTTSTWATTRSSVHTSRS